MSQTFSLRCACSPRVQGVWGVGGKDLEGCCGARKASGEVGVVECLCVGGWPAFSVWGGEREGSLS